MKLARLWVAILTKDQEGSGTDSEIALVIRQAGVEVLNYTFPDTEQSDLEKGVSNLYEVDVSSSNITPENLDDDSIEIRILDDDELWRPLHILIWGERQSSPLATLDTVVPLAIEMNIAPGLSSEGDSTLPIRRVSRGRSSTMPINRLLILTKRAALQSSSPSIKSFEVQVVSEGRLVVLSEIRATPQPDGIEGEANFYSAPVLSPFTKSQLTNQSIVLRVRDISSWEPENMFIFGLSKATGRPDSMVPLVHLPRWPYGSLEMDITNGMTDATMPLAKDPPVSSDPIIEGPLR